MKKILLRNLSRCYRRLILAIGAFYLTLLAQHAAAAPGDTLTLTAGSTFTYDTNVFRLSPIIDPVPLTGLPRKSDQIIDTSVILALNKTYSMQRFEATGRLVDNRYMNFEFLDFLGKNYNLAWHWYVTPYLHGRLTNSHSEALNNFANLTGFVNATTQNLRTTDNFHFDGVFEINRAWHVLGGIDHNVVKNSRINVQDFDNKITSVEGGIRYVLPSRSSLTYKVRSGRGEFINRPTPNLSSLFDTRFDEMEHEVRLIWPITAKFGFEGSVGHLQREHLHFPRRDFGGVVGGVNFNWSVTAKTRISASWSHRLYNSQTSLLFRLPDPNYQPFSSSYVVSDRFSLEPVWQITDKTALRARYDYSIVDFRGAVNPFPANRQDTIHSGLIALDWKPLNLVALTAVFQRDHRSSTHSGFDFDSTAGSISAMLNF